MLDKFKLDNRLPLYMCNYACTAARCLHIYVYSQQEKKRREQKMEMKSWQCFLVVLLFVNNINSSNVLAQDTSCLNVLAPCLNYLNGTRHPPDICCDPLKSVIKSNPKCMCSMISNRGTTKAEQAGINITEAQQLPARCGQHVNPISCLSSKPPSPWPFFPYVCDPIQLFFVSTY